MRLSSSIPVFHCSMQLCISHFIWLPLGQRSLDTQRSLENLVVNYTGGKYWHSIPPCLARSLTLSLLLGHALIDPFLYPSHGRVRRHSTLPSTESQETLNSSLNIDTIPTLLCCPRYQWAIGIKVDARYRSFFVYIWFLSLYSISTMGESLWSHLWLRHKQL